jgi:mannose-6-phosphate isomerase class I
MNRNQRSMSVSDADVRARSINDFQRMLEEDMQELSLMTFRNLQQLQNNIDDSIDEIVATINSLSMAMEQDSRSIHTKLTVLDTKISIMDSKIDLLLKSTWQPIDSKSPDNGKIPRL